jgi:hypothetical protein
MKRPEMPWGNLSRVSNHDKSEFKSRYSHLLPKLRSLVLLRTAIGGKIENTYMTTQYLSYF